MTNSLAGSAQKFFPGPPSGSARDGVIAFDVTTTPYTAYVMLQGTWQVFGGAGASPSPANPTAIAGPVAINGVASTYMRSDAAPAIQKASNVAYGIVAVDGTTITSAGGVISAAAGATGGNPTATAGPAAINGVAATFMRSDAAPAIQQATSGQKGIVQVDGTSITAAAGVISAAQSPGTVPIASVTLPNGKIAKGNGSNQAAAVDDVADIIAVIDGGGSAIQAGKLIYIPVDFNATIEQVTLLADQSGSITCNIWKCTYAQFDAGATHPVSGDSITAGATPAISSATKYQDATLTGWTTAIAAGSVLAFEIPSNATAITRLTAALKVAKT